MMKKKAKVKEPYPILKFIPKIQSRAAISIIFAYAFDSLDKVKAIISMLNRQGKVVLEKS